VTKPEPEPKKETRKIEVPGGILEVPEGVRAATPAEHLKDAPAQRLSRATAKPVAQALHSSNPNPPHALFAVVSSGPPYLIAPPAPDTVCTAHAAS
jgi:hypothetical protein